MLTAEQLKENFTAEELAVFGETETVTELKADEIKTEDKKEPDASLETGERAEPEKEKAAESETELAKEEKEETLEEGKPVPYDRFSKVYGKAKAGERAAFERDEIKEKFELFKTNPESYYEKYPDEKPADYKPATERSPEKPSTPPPTKILSMREVIKQGAKINDPQNPEYHGKTLAEIMAVGPEGIAAAQDYYQEYVESIRDEVKKAKEAEENQVKTLRDEDDRFMDGRAQDLFKKSAADLSKDEKAKVEKVASDTLAWMKKNGRMAYKLDDAYKLMKYDESIKDAKETGARSAIDHAKSGGSARTVSATVGNGAQGASVYDRLFDASEKDLEKAIDRMSDVQFAAFRKNAPVPFREKHPEIPW